MTEFESRIIEYVKKSDNTQASCWDIARGAFPEKWSKMQSSGIRRRDEASGRGALVGHVKRTAIKSEYLGYLPGRDRWDSGIVYYRGD